MEYGSEFGLVSLRNARQLFEGLGMNRMLRLCVFAREHFAEEPMKTLKGSANEDDARDGEEDANEKPAP
jgi:hypothetical protein